MSKLNRDAISLQARDRFWAAVSKTDSCWLFSGSRGYVRIDGQLCRADQVAWVLASYQLPAKGKLRDLATAPNEGQDRRAGK